MWTELPEDADVSGGVRTENGGLPAQPAVIKEYGRFAYLEGNAQADIHSFIHSYVQSFIHKYNCISPLLDFYVRWENRHGRMRKKCFNLKSLCNCGYSGLKCWLECASKLQDKLFFFSCCFCPPLCLQPHFDP